MLAALLLNFDKRGRAIKPAWTPYAKPPVDRRRKRKAQQLLAVGLLRR